MIRTILGLVFNRWVLLAIVFVALAIVIWHVGPIVQVGEWIPLASESSRWIAIGVLALVIAVAIAWGVWSARRRNTAVVEQLVQRDDAAGPAESADLAATRERFEQAMTTLRRSRFGKDGFLAGLAARFGGRYVYELPWYLIIGAPGSGKTTALRNCGLQFPLMGTLGRDPIKGVGGTRNCDWWFTNEAVLIDTAGRFTTQDSDATNDRTTWSGFLDMLKRVRPRQPVNGVLVTVSIPDLLSADAGERDHYARTVRQRLQELGESLGIAFPVYLLVTKADLLAGFTDYFATLDKDQRTAAWGATLAMETPTGERNARLANELDGLQKRLDDGLVDTLQPERDAQRRARIYGFPNQFACVRAPLVEFLDTVFSPSPYERETLLRGLYFISGTQEGTPIDRVIGTIARTFGVERAIVEPNASSGKSFFLARLLQDVVFAERGLAGTDRRIERRKTLLAFGAYALIACVTLGLLAAWASSWLANRRYVDEVATRAEELRGLALAADRTVSIDPRSVSPTLDAMRSLVDEPAATGIGGLGLSQQDKLRSATDQAYDRMLAALLWPTIELEVEDRLQREFARPVAQYDSLKTYLMLHDAERFRKDDVKRYVLADWDGRFARGIDQEQRQRLEGHLDRLVAQGSRPTLRKQDDALVERLRANLGRESLPARILDRLAANGLGTGLPDFTVRTAAGPNAPLVFRDDALAAKVPGLYSRKGYAALKERVRGVTEQLAQEQSWVLGEKDASVSARLANPQTIEQVYRLYLQTYTNRWQAFIGSIAAKPITNSNDAMNMTQWLSASNTPLVPLAKAIARETTLTQALPGDDKAFGLAIPKGITNAGRSVTSALGVKDPDTLAKENVDDKFEAQRAFAFGPPDGKAPVDALVVKLGELQQVLMTADMAVKAGQAPPPAPATVALQAEAKQLPQPARSVVQSLVDQSSRQSLAGLRDTLSKDVRSTLGEFCRAALIDRYPFKKNATLEVQQQDFAAVFATGGKFDQLMLRLAPYVDTASRPWRMKPYSDGGTLGGDANTLAQLQRAQSIKEAFFPPGSSNGAIQLSFKPIEMDTTITQFNLDVDGQLVRYEHGPQMPSNVTWPAPRASNQVRLQLVPAPTMSTPNLVFDSSWALYRLFDSYRVEPTPAPEKIVVTFDVGGRKARFEVGARSVRNPLNLAELRAFSCPMGL